MAPLTRSKHSCDGERHNKRQKNINEESLAEKKDVIDKLLNLEMSLLKCNNYICNNTIYCASKETFYMTNIFAKLNKFAEECGVITLQRRDSEEMIPNNTAYRYNLQQDDENYENVSNVTYLCKHIDAMINCKRQFLKYLELLNDIIGNINKIIFDKEKIHLVSTNKINDRKRPIISEGISKKRSLRINKKSKSNPRPMIIKNIDINSPLSRTRHDNLFYDTKTNNVKNNSIDKNHNIVGLNQNNETNSQNIDKNRLIFHKKMKYDEQNASLINYRNGLFRSIENIIPLNLFHNMKDRSEIDFNFHNKGIK